MKNLPKKFVDRYNGVCYNLITKSVGTDRLNLYVISRHGITASKERHREKDFMSAEFLSKIRLHKRNCKVYQLRSFVIILI